MQRLFSMFPTGAAGAALLVLRVSVAATLVVNGTAGWALVTPFWIPLGLAVLATSLCIGLFTPYCSAAGCLVQLYLLVVAGGRDEFHPVMSILHCGALAVLGPGAYSVDSRIFGRKLLTLPPRR